jgi:SAM-dependent methyltransferase
MKNSELFRGELFEHVRCNLCGASDGDADVVFDADPRHIPRSRDEIIAVYSAASSDVFYERIVRCRRCGLMYVSPRPKQELITEGYSQAEDKNYVSQEKGRQRTFEKCLRTIRTMRSTGKLLDVGAASGIFVKIAADAGYEAYGIEPSQWMCAVAKREYGVKVLPGMIEDAKLEDGSFDIVTMWDVLEHTFDPMRTLTSIRRILKPGGFLFINYPRIDDPLARLAGRRWWFLLSIHLFYFTPRTLSAFLERAGFKTLAHKRHYQWLAYDYLVYRLSVYSASLARLAKIPYFLPGFRKLLIPYFASQYLLISQKTL